MTALDDLEELVRGAQGVRVDRSRKDLPAIHVEHDECVGDIYLQGAHVTRWTPQGMPEILFVSGQSAWTPGKAIRGGVPICFPWFGPKADNPAAPQHGFARMRTWKPVKVSASQAGVTVEMEYRSDSETRKLWPHDFTIVHRVTFGAALNMDLEVTNSGSESFVFEEAQHSYFRVGDVERVALYGLEGAEYLDKTEDYARKRQQGAIEIRGETDRIYESSANVVIEDGRLNRKIKVNKSNSRTTVVWNPWIDRARALSDFDDDEWKDMVCVETTNVRDRAIRLQPGESHRMQTEITVKE